MLIKIIAQRDFEIFFECNYSKLYGCETLYPEDLQNTLIKTFIDKNIQNFCFQIDKICLYPKYTFDDKKIFAIADNKYIVLSDEIYDKYFYNCEIKQYNLNIIYNLPKVDLIKLKRINGDFPQDNSIDILLTKYLENSMVINLNQQFTLYFNCNDIINSANYITFEINEIIYSNDIKKYINQRLEEMNLTIEFNKNINNLTEFIGVDKCENSVYNYSWLHYTSKNNILGYIANSEVKVDFIVSEELIKPIKPIKPIKINENPHIFNTINNKCIQSNQQDQQDQQDQQYQQYQQDQQYQREKEKVLTKEELREKRILALSKKI